MQDRLLDFQRGLLTPKRGASHLVLRFAGDHEHHLARCRDALPCVGHSCSLTVSGVKARHA